MARRLLQGLAICLTAGSGWAQNDPGPTPDNRTVLGADEFLTAGAEAIRMGHYDDGIRLTEIGLNRSPRSSDRAAALSNLCAARAAKGEADVAIDHCTASLAINPRNWRAYSNRAYAYYVKGMYPQARFDLASAEELAPSARQVLAIKGMINERVLQPRVIMEDHQ